MTLYGASEEAARPRAGLVPPRPASGHSTEGRDELTPVLLRRGVSREGLPLRLGLRDGNTSDRTEPPVAMEACVALGLDGVRGMGGRQSGRWSTSAGSVPGAAGGAHHLGAASGCGAPGGRGVGAAARRVARMARKTWADPSGAVAMLAWTKRRPSRASGVCGRASRRSRETLSGRPLEPGSPASSHGVCRRPSHRGRACRRAHPARGSPRVGLCGRRRGGQQRLCRPGAGTAGPPAASLALSCAPLSCRSSQHPHKAAAARPSAEGRGPPGRGPLSPGRAPRGPAPL